MTKRDRRAYLAEYRKRPEVAARLRLARQDPKRKTYMKAYCKTPAFLAKARVYGAKYCASPNGAAVRKRYAASKRGKEVLLKAQLKHYFGLTEKDYERMFKSQNGLCAICEKPNLNGRRLFIDHDHSTNRVRALLCHSCNSVIGHARESVLTLYKAADYLERHGRK